MGEVACQHDILGGPIAADENMIFSEDLAVNVN